MASEEQKYLADFIKSTHATLREEARNYGSEIAWKRHVNRKDVLQKYASSMYKLATTYWIENSSYSRIEWIKSQCKEYFLNGGKDKYDNRETEIRLKIDVNSQKIKVTENNDTPKIEERISLLDVGSCFNPFGKLDIFKVTAIDLNKVPHEVLYCDFLNVHVEEETIYSNDKQEVLQFCKDSFNVVVFSLFLEYLPCPQQRYVCCKKAYELLKPGGILFIITPDSKHVNANARIIKSWRYVLSKLGFMRIKYEKLKHVHCIIYRKCMMKYVATRWADLQKLPENDPLFLNDTMIYIPQDFRTIPDKIETEKRVEYNADETVCMFNELPFE